MPRRIKGSKYSSGFGQCDAVLLYALDNHTYKVKCSLIAPHVALKHYSKELPDNQQNQNWSNHIEKV